MSREQYLYEEFVRVTKILNSQLHITPVLYGSLGFGKVAQTNFFPQDIDILVPLVYLEEKWDALYKVMKQVGYSLADLNEHEFYNGEIQIGFSFIEDLKNFAGVNYMGLESVEDDGVVYYLLTIEDYLKVYTKSSKDGYRRTKNNEKDLKKLEFFKKIKEADG